MKHKVNHAISNNEPLICIGFQLPDFSLSDLNISKEFTKPVYFSGSQFFGKANFSNTEFKGGANFLAAKFQVGTSFEYAKFQGEASFSESDFDGLSTTFSNSEFYGKTRFSAALTTTTIPTPAFAHHEQMLRDMGIGYNDYDDDGVTCAATDEQADAWSDQFFNHHNVNIAYLKACEAKEQKYSYDPNADNLAHQEDLLGQWDSIYGENNENFAPDFGTFGK